MSATNGSPGRLHQVVDAVVYALAVTVLVLVVALVLAGLLYEDVAQGLVLITFVGGFVIFGYGTFQLRPSSAWKKARSSEAEDEIEIARTETDARAESIGQAEHTPFQAAVQEVPPLRWYSIPPDQRLPTGVKIFLSGVLVLLASLLIDVLLNGAFA